jgi:hypothetical protein
VRVLAIGISHEQVETPILALEAVSRVIDQEGIVLGCVGADSRDLTPHLKQSSIQQYANAELTGVRIREYCLKKLRILGWANELAVNTRATAIANE